MAASVGRNPKTPAPGTTKLADDTEVDKPQTTQPGDAPADTTDPKERVTSVNPDAAAAAAEGHLSVNGVVPLPAPEAPAALPSRKETYFQYTPQGDKKKVTRDLNTGETTVADAT